MGGGDIRPVRGESPIGRRHPAAAMSRRDKSSVEIGAGAGCPEPLQGLDRVFLRESRVSACICSQAFYGVLRGQRAICGGGRHNGYSLFRISKKIVPLHPRLTGYESEVYIYHSAVVHPFCGHLHLLRQRKGLRNGLILLWFKVLQLRNELY